MEAQIAIIGGVGLILFGIRFLRKGLDRLFGGHLIPWLSKLAKKPWKAFAAGIGAGVVSPSSTGISIMAVQLLGGGQIRPEGILAMLLGANVGMTVTIQMMAFRVQDYAGLMITGGVIAFLYGKRDLVRGIGQCILALGFIFLAIKIIGEGADIIVKSEETKEVFALLVRHPLLIFAATALLAVTLQSSTASLGLAIGLFASGELSAAIAGQEIYVLILWVLGTNVGVGISSLIVGWGSTEPRRLGVANVVTKLGLAVPLMFFPDFSIWFFQLLPGDVVSQTVIYHTLFNFFVGLVALPILTPIKLLSYAVVPLPEKGIDGQEETHLDPSSLEAPTIALARATRETLRMADAVRIQLKTFWQACRTSDAELARKIQKQDDRIDAYQRSLLDYLNRIAGERNKRDDRWQLALMSFAIELETVGDLIEKHLSNLVIKQREKSLTLPPEDWKSLERVYRRLLSNYEHIMSQLTIYNLNEIKAVIEAKHEFNEECRQLQQVHYARLRSGSRSDLINNAFFIDFLTGLQHINSHVTNLAHALAAMSESKPEDAEEIQESLLKGPEENPLS